MLIDTSDSVAPKLKFEQEAAISFLQSVLKEKNDRALLVEFDTGVTLLQDFTGDPNKLAKEIRKLKAAGGTALYDAIYMTCDEKMIRETGRFVKWPGSPNNGQPAAMPGPQTHDDPARL